MSSLIQNKVYLVTGGNRGLGLGLVQALLANPHHTVVATVRSERAKHDLTEEIAKSTIGTGSMLHIAQFDFSSAVPAGDVRESIEQLGISHIDTLILNAGNAQSMVPASQTTAEDLRVAFETNTIAPLLVFQGLWPLLQRSATSPKLIWITSSLGSITEMDSLGGGAYGPSRAAQNWLTRSLHLEFNKPGQDPRLIAIALHPGWVQTRMGQLVVDQWQSSLKALDFNIEKPPTTVEQSVAGMMTVINGATANESGTFLTFDGKHLAW